MALARISNFAIDTSLIYFAIQHPGGGNPFVWVYADIPDGNTDKPSYYWPKELGKPLLAKLEKTPGFIVSDGIAINLSKVITIRDNQVIEFNLISKGISKFELSTETFQKVINSLST